MNHIAETAQADERGHEESPTSTARATRRVFLKVLGQAGVVVGLAGLASLAGKHDPWLRPPGAVPEGEFLARCLRCQKCQEVCPTGAINPVLVVEDPVYAGTPRLNFQRGYCTLCRRCIEVCPTGALRPIEGTTAHLGVARIDPERCVAWAWGGCTRCVAECPSQAIALDASHRPVIDTARCNGCGTCEYNCPSTSLLASIAPIGRGIVVLPLQEGHS